MRGEGEPGNEATREYRCLLVSTDVEAARAGTDGYTDTHSNPRACAPRVVDNHCKDTVDTGFTVIGGCHAAYIQGHLSPTTKSAKKTKPEHFRVLQLSGMPGKRLKTRGPASSRARLYLLAAAAETVAAPPPTLATARRVLCTSASPSPRTASPPSGTLRGRLFHCSSAVSPAESSPP